MKIREIYINKQFPDVEVKIVDIGKYTYRDDNIIFRQIRPTYFKECSSLPKVDFFRFYEKKNSR